MLNSSNLVKPLFLNSNTNISNLNAQVRDTSIEDIMRCHGNCTHNSREMRKTIFNPQPSK